jgi:hypothetical protein
VILTHQKLFVMDIDGLNMFFSKSVVKEKTSEGMGKGAVWVMFSEVKKSHEKFEVWNFQMFFEEIKAQTFSDKLNHWTTSWQRSLQKSQKVPINKHFNPKLKVKQNQSFNIELLKRMEWFVTSKCRRANAVEVEKQNLALDFSGPRRRREICRQYLCSSQLLLELQVPWLKWIKLDS